jgi:hypothetical protein
VSRSKQPDPFFQAFQAVATFIAKTMFDPATRSRTVLDTRTSPGCAIATMRDAMWTAIPLRSLSGHFDFARVKSRPHLQAKILDGLAYGQRIPA